MYNKDNENYDLFLAGLISENKYYELCEGKKHKKNHMAKDVTGDGKADFADIMASRMIAGGMDKEEAIKKAHAIHNKSKKKKKKKKKAHCYEATMPDAPLRMGHGLDNKFKMFIAQLGKSELSRSNLKNLAFNFIMALHDAMVEDEKITDSTAKSMLLRDIKMAFKQADDEIKDK